MSTVKRLLITGDDTALEKFHMFVCMVLNGIERRGQTVLYTCTPEDYQRALEHAKNSGVTVQEWNGREWAVVLKGDSPAWASKKHYYPAERETTEIQWPVKHAATLESLDNPDQLAQKIPDIIYCDGYYDAQLRPVAFRVTVEPILLDACPGCNGTGTHTNRLPYCTTPMAHHIQANIDELGQL